MNETKSLYNMRVDVETAYISEQSIPEAQRFVFSYTITIRNTGSIAAKLLTRHWIITDAEGNVQEVQGKGVVGEQPDLEPGKNFRYTSSVVIETPVGSMHGSYHMMAVDGVEFEADIPAFTISVPNALH